MIKVLLLAALVALACRAVLGKWPWEYLRGSDSRSAALASARRLLGVAPGASARDIREAHRRKATLDHPDRGGSTIRQQELNAARDLLLAQLPPPSPSTPEPPA